MKVQSGAPLAIALLLASIVAIGVTGSVDAKLAATLSTDSAGPGDTVTLTSARDSEGVTQGGQAVHVFLLPGTTDPTNTACQQADALPLGTLTWNHSTGVGSLTFRGTDVG